MTAEDAVRHLLALYPARHDVRDVEGYVALFAANGAFVGGNARHEGRGAIREFITATYASQAAERRTKHLCGNSLIEIRGAEATAETDFVAYERYGAEPWRIHTIGRYHDRLVLENGQWLFLERRVATIGSSTPR